MSKRLLTGLASVISSCLIATAFAEHEWTKVDSSTIENDLWTLGASWNNGQLTLNSATPKVDGLTTLEMVGNPVKVMPGVVSYLVQGAEAVTLAEGAANVAPTVLPMTSDGRIRIVTMGEDGSTMTYRLKTRGGFAIHDR